MSYATTTENQFGSLTGSLTAADLTAIEGSDEIAITHMNMRMFESRESAMQAARKYLAAQIENLKLLEEKFTM
jgi:hypothetical protein